MSKAYDLFIEPAALIERKNLPGKIRQRVKQVISDLANEPRPSNSVSLDTTQIDLPIGIELRRVRLEKWRLIYAISDNEQWVWVWGIRQRPPYDYDDLGEFVNQF